MAYKFRAEIDGGVLSLAETETTTQIEHFPLDSAVRNLSRRVKWNRFWQGAEYVGGTAGLTAAVINLGLLSNGIHHQEVFGINFDLEALTLINLITGIADFSFVGVFAQNAAKDRLKLATIKDVITMENLRSNRLFTPINPSYKLVKNR